MTVASLKVLARFLLIFAGTVLIALGSLALLANLSGPEPIFLGWVFSHTYIRLAPTSAASSVYAIVFGCAAIGVGALIVAKALLGRRVP